MGLSWGGWWGTGGESKIQDQEFAVLFAVGKHVHGWKGYISDKNIEVNIWRGVFPQQSCWGGPWLHHPCKKKDLTRVCETMRRVIIHLRHSNIFPASDKNLSQNTYHMLSINIMTQKCLCFLIRKPAEMTGPQSGALLWGTEACEELIPGQKIKIVTIFLHMLPN